MSTHSPQQEFFTALRKELKKDGYDVYDGALPPNGTPYPFIYMGASNMAGDQACKDIDSARILQTVHAWHDDPGKRGTVSGMLIDIQVAARQITVTNNYRFSFVDATEDILPDTTTKTPLLHGVVSVTVNAMRR